MEKLEVPMTEHLDSILRHMQFLEHVPRPQPLEGEIEDLREELAQLLFEQEPDSIYRRWLTARVKNVGHNVQTPEERDFVGVQEFDHNFVYYGAEIFERAYADKLPSVLKLLERVGATDTRDLLQKAMDMLGHPYPDTQIARRKAWNKRASRKVKKNQWELDLDALYGEYFELEERCVDVAAKRAVEGYRQRGMPIPPVIPARQR